MVPKVTVHFHFLSRRRFLTSSSIEKFDINVLSLLAPFYSQEKRANLSDTKQNNKTFIYILKQLGTVQHLYSLCHANSTQKSKPSFLFLYIPLTLKSSSFPAILIQFPGH